MRKIRFRCWDYKKKAFVNPSLIGIRCDGSLIAPDSTWLNCSLSDLSISQYTNLKDRNGKEIYEGDIVNFHIFQSPMGNLKEEYNGQIIWHKNGFVIEFINKWRGFDGEKDFQDLYAHASRKDRIEIIGNIYENLELMPKERSEG